MFRRGRFLGQELASAKGKSRRAAGRMEVHRARRKELLGNEHVLTRDLSTGSEAPWTIVVINEVNDEPIDPAFEYLSTCQTHESARLLYNQRQAAYERELSAKGDRADGKTTGHDRVRLRNLSPVNKTHSASISFFTFCVGFRSVRSDS